MIAERNGLNYESATIALATAESPSKTYGRSPSKQTLNNAKQFLESDAFQQGMVEYKSYHNVSKPIADTCLAIEMILLNKPMGEI